MRWLILLLVLILVSYSVSAQDACSQIGGFCDSVCEVDEEPRELNEPCGEGLLCCVSSIQSLNNMATAISCFDGTAYSACSDFSIGGLGKPNYCNNGDLISNCEVCGCPGGNVCENGVCLSIGGIESFDLSLVNSPPIISQIPILSTPFDSVELYLYAQDPEGQALIFSFSDGSSNLRSDLIDCDILGSVFSCTPKANGPAAIELFASDGQKVTEMIFTIDVVTFFIDDGSNERPVANAGRNSVVSVNQNVVLDGSGSYDIDGGIPSLDSAFTWKENGIPLGSGKVFKTKFSRVGVHNIVLEVTDNGGSIGTDTVSISVRDKRSCKNTNAVYVPDDTVCTKKWPSNEGDILAINSRSNSCDLFEVCDEGLDFIVEEAIDCCDGSPFLDRKRSSSCAYANRNSQGNVRTCQAIYLVKGFGDGAIYMQDYFYSEMCCYGVRELCPVEYQLYGPGPTPLTDGPTIPMQCKTSSDSRVLGEWVSDSRIDKNNIALQDLHTGATVNILSTGTCVDYNSALVTLLRKLGIKSEDVYMVEATNHAYGLIRFPLDRKYTLVDTTGNSDPITIGNIPPNDYDYCENMVSCYNDNGKVPCPELKKIKGCEGIKESIIKQGSRITFKTKETGENIFNKLAEEATR